MNNDISLHGKRPFGHQACAVQLSKCRLIFRSFIFAIFAVNSISGHAHTHKHTFVDVEMSFYFIFFFFYYCDMDLMQQECEMLAL